MHVYRLRAISRMSRVRDVNNSNKVVTAAGLLARLIATSLRIVLGHILLLIVVEQIFK